VLTFEQSIVYTFDMEKIQLKFLENIIKISVNIYKHN